MGLGRGCGWVLNAVTSQPPRPRTKSGMRKGKLGEKWVARKWKWPRNGVVRKRVVLYKVVYLKVYLAEE